MYLVLGLKDLHGLSLDEKVIFSAEDNYYHLVAKNFQEQFETETDDNGQFDPRKRQEQTLK